MAKRKPRGLPYRRFRINKRAGKYKYGYVSKLTGRRIPRSILTPNWDLLGFRESFSDYWVEAAHYKTVKLKNGKKKRIKVPEKRHYKAGLREKRIKGVRKYISEVRTLGQNPIEDSPGLKRYFNWLRDKRNKKTALFAPVVKSYGGDPKAVQLFLEFEERQNARSIPPSFS